MTSREESIRQQLTGVVVGRSLGEQQHPADHCDLDGHPHLGPCVEPGTHTDGTFVEDEWPDAEPIAGPRCTVAIPDDAIPNGHGGWWLPQPEPDPDAEPVDLSGWREAGCTEDVPYAPALGLEPHHAAARRRTRGEHDAAEGAKYARVNRERRERGIR